MKEKLWLICGTEMSKLRGRFTEKQYKEVVFNKLDDLLANKRALYRDWTPEIMEGCCKKCADEYAEDWANERCEGTFIHHFPAKKGEYLQRNVKMVDEEPELVVAFWDGFSYGTAHTIARAVDKHIQIIIKRM